MADEFTDAIRDRIFCPASKLVVDRVGVNPTRVSHVGVALWAIRWRLDAWAQALAVRCKALLMLMLVAVAGLPLPAVAVDWNANALMAWAERTYPLLFPGPQVDQHAPPYVYRYYPQTGNYIGLDGDVVYVLGPVSNGQLLQVGSLSSFECPAKGDDCRPLMPPLFTGETVGLFMDSTSRLLVLGNNSATPQDAGMSLPNQRLRVLAANVAQAVATDLTGLMVTSDGRLLGWGRGFWSPAFSITPATAPVSLDVGGLVTQVALIADGNSFIVLLVDGSVAYWQGPAQAVGGSIRGARFSIATPGPIRQIAIGGGTTPYLLARDGRVWRGYAFAVRPPIEVPGATDVRQISCGFFNCAAVRHDGTVLTWAAHESAARRDVVSSPAAVTGIAHVTAEGYWMAAVGADGSLWSTPGGQAFPGAVLQRVDGFGNAAGVNCSFTACLVLRGDRTLWGWGFVGNTRGLFGAGATSNEVRSSPPPVQVQSVRVP